MARKPLRSQLNQIRTWVRQGRTDAWIAHQLEVSGSELREFRRRHELAPDDEPAGEVDLRDEIEAEIEATMSEEELEAEDDEEELEEAAAQDDAGDEDEGGPGDGASRADGRDGGGGRPRRRRRGGRKRGRRSAPALQASFDHGEKDGYGLWLDPAVSDDPTYTEHWAGHRPVEVTIEPDRIVIRRTEAQ